jgi:hypothetical protein
MDLRVTSNLLSAYGAFPRRDVARVLTSSQGALTTTLPLGFMSRGGSQLIAETQEDIANGYRRIRTFENEDGRQFTRIEDIIVANGNTRRSVIQQNPSGSITRYEEALDREPGGDFRRTQRFQNEAGETATQITPAYRVTDPFTLGGGIGIYANVQTSFAGFRGTRLDLSA